MAAHVRCAYAACRCRAVMCRAGLQKRFAARHWYNQDMGLTKADTRPQTWCTRIAALQVLAKHRERVSMECVITGKVTHHVHTSPVVCITGDPLRIERLNAAQGGPFL